MLNRPAHILVVDDEAPNRRLLSRILQHEGHQITEAADADEALAKLLAAPFDLVYLDVMMPGRDGIDLLAELRDRDETRSLPVVLVTALNSMEHKVRGLDAGADDFLTKPVNQSELRARTHTLLRVKALHDAETRARRELERKNAELLRLQEMKESLTQMVVHDLKNPLTAILGHVDLMVARCQATPGDRNLQSLGSLRRSAGAMLRMVTDLLDLHLLEEDSLKVKPRSIEPRAVLDEARREFEAEALREGRELRLEPAAIDGAVRADPDLLRRVLGNLIGNALKHSAEAGRVSLRARNAGGMIRFEVADDGQGIAEEHRQRIFEKFARIDSDGVERTVNRGLGLTFCRMAVEAMGGEIQVEGEPGGGSCFWFTLPLDACAAELRRGAAAAGAPPA